MSGVTVVVPNWNRRHLLERLLDCLGHQTYPTQEILVVDNGSEDDSAKMAAAQGARVIQMGKNAGFSRAVNRGIREGRTPWLAIVNNDVAPAPDWLAQLIRAADETQAWFATGKLMNAVRHDSIDGVYDAVCRGGCAWRVGHGRRDGPEWESPRPIQFASLTATLFRARLFEEVGLLDERFESYVEDTDFGLRCAMKGYNGVYTPEARAYHIGSATLGAWHSETVRRISRNQLLLVAKHYPKKWLVRFAWAIVVAQTLWGMLALRHGAGVAFLRGKIEGLRQFRTLRRAAESACWAADPESFARILEESERDILTLQQRTGFDLYWRLYFALT
jgi:GT2 family glycosyltransferase